MRNLSFGLLIVGALFLFWTLLFDAAPDGTYNIGELQKQMLIAQFGSLCILTGSIFFAVNKVLVEMRKAGILPPDGK
jgi:hypothetical protein